MSAVDRLQGLAFNLAIKAPCLCVATGPITLNGAQTVDGVALSGNGTERVLVTDQADPTTNGIYVANTSAWARDVDFLQPTDCAQGTIVCVVEGAVNAQTVWQLTTASPVIGTTALAFSVMGAAALSVASAWIRTNLLPALSQAAAQTALGVPPTSAVILAALLTTQGDMIVRGASGPARLALGANGTSLMSNGTTAVWGTASAIAPRSYLAGLTLSNDSVTPNSVLDIAAGLCADSTNTASIALGAFTKSTAGAWAAGSGSNGMGNGLTVAPTTWYHVFAIINSGVVDVYFDTSVAAANKPSSTTAFRRIGSFLTDGSSHIVAFVQNGDRFGWATPVNDVNGRSGSATAALVTLTVPTGIAVESLSNWNVVIGSTGTQQLLTNPAQADTAPSSTNFSFGTDGVPSESVYGGQHRIMTNTNAQIRLRGSNGAGTINNTTIGWLDRRGRDS